MWSYSMLGWYETRETQIVLPETLKQETKTQILTIEEKEGKDNETLGY